MYQAHSLPLGLVTLGAETTVQKWEMRLLFLVHELKWREYA